MATLSAQSKYHLSTFGVTIIVKQMLVFPHLFVFGSFASISRCLSLGNQSPYLQVAIVLVTVD